jgi:hypothetical protein
VDRYMDENGKEQPERRKHINLRPLFDDVARRVEPFFQQSGELNGIRADFWIARTIADAYPDLSNEDVNVLAKAVTRYHQER